MNYIERAVLATMGLEERYKDFVTYWTDVYMDDSKLWERFLNDQMPTILETSYFKECVEDGDGMEVADLLIREHRKYCQGLAEQKWRYE